ncbi:hypothetical protein HK104_009349 [Borealophlyctis nickersoniae]|nr:hypothetical protein HK104_009349 [Borealophlyctis nickersoniae]
MASNLFQYLVNKIDPIQFFSSSPSSNVVPYSIPSPSSKSLLPAGYANDLFDFEDGQQDLASFALQNYVLAVLSSPLTVVETLSEVQYQKRDDGDEEADGETPSAVEKLQPLQGGVWENVREIVEFQGEGWTGLLKGHFTNFLFNASYTVLQPALEEAINDVFDVYEDTNPATLVLSHVVVGGLLSPLELIRTRLIVQPSHSKKYYGPIHAIHAIAAEEPNGLSSFYSSRHLIPSVILHGLNPLLRLVSEHIIADELGLDPTFTPVLYRVATLAFMAIEVAVVTPLDMARKRIQVQKLGQIHSRFRPRRRESDGDADKASDTTSVASPSAFEPCVEVSSKHYGGVLDALKSIVAEEGGKAKKRKAKKRKTRDALRGPVVGGPPGLGSPLPGRGGRYDIDGSMEDWRKVWGEGSADPAQTAGTLLHDDPFARPGPGLSGSSYRSRDAYGMGHPSKEPRSSDTGGYFGALGRFGSGVKTLYRGFWARYISRVVIYAFEEIGKGEEW